MTKGTGSMSDAEWHMKQAIERAGTQGGMVHAAVAIAAALLEVADAMRGIAPKPKPSPTGWDEREAYHAEIQDLRAELKELRGEQ
jgi:hypothetical protein